jgi:hypothetical protein
MMLTTEHMVQAVGCLCLLTRTIRQACMYERLLNDGCACHGRSSISLRRS